VQQCASPENLYEKPENAFVANFIGENNRLMGSVEAINGDQVTVKQILAIS
jgi:putative spermidine/putrescine transport system ATP-binding protein